MLDYSTVNDIILLGKQVPGVWVVKHEMLPFTVNEARRWHHHTLAKHVKEWREAGCWLARQAKVPKMRSANIHCVSLLKRMNRDLGAEFLALKALQDGAITDAGVMPDDRPPYVRSVTFHAPIKYPRAGMAMLIERCESS